MIYHIGGSQSHYYTASSKSAGVTKRLSQKTKTLKIVFFTIRSGECFYTTFFKTQVFIIAKQRIGHSGVAGTLPPKDLEATVAPRSFYKCFAWKLGWVMPRPLLSSDCWLLGHGGDRKKGPRHFKEWMPGVTAMKDTLEMRKGPPSFRLHMNRTGMASQTSLSPLRWCC